MVYCQWRVDAVTVSQTPVKLQLDQHPALLRLVVWWKANASPHHFGINLPRCQASSRITRLELFIFISTDARSSDKHAYVIASLRLVMMLCFDPQRIWGPVVT